MPFKRNHRRRVVLLLMPVLVLVQVLSLSFCADKKDQIPVEGFSDGTLEYVGSETCRGCHGDAYTNWRHSHHFQAMLPATDSSVLGNFDSTSFQADGVQSRMYRRDDGFFIQTEAADGKSQEFKVVYTFGFYPLQQYLVAFPGGRLQTTRLSWDSREGKWFHQYAGQSIPPGDWLHWTGNGQNWNTMCANCHSTNLKKNYDPQSDSYRTEYEEVNVSCESCHGPGSRHIAWISSTDYKKADGPPNSGFLYGQQTDNREQINTCAPCHSRKADIAADALHSGELLDDIIPQILSTEFYFADGQIREENYVYGSFVQSKMFHRNVRCTQCHEPHSGALRLEGNALCLSCHEPGYNSAQHHFHPEGTAAAQCISCHMPERTYMGNDVRGDHSFRVPRPDQSAIYGTPNTCNTCHANRSPQWAANAIEQWYGPKRAKHFSDALLPGSLLDEHSAGHLIPMLGDTSYPDIARATAAFYLGQLQDANGVSALRDALHSPSAVVRYYALRSLKNFSPEYWMQEALPLLRDPVRGVRIAAGDLYHGMAEADIPASWREAYHATDRENMAYLTYQTDFAAGNVMLGDYHLQGGRASDAVSAYVRALQKDAQLNYARLNLSAAYNALGQNTQALETLRQAAEQDPENDRVWFNLGLLYAELGQTELAIKSFERAVSLHSPDPALYYNFGVLLQQEERWSEAENILRTGMQLQPDSENLHYAMVFLYRNTDRLEKAKKELIWLIQRDGDNPEYRQMLEALGGRLP